MFEKFRANYNLDYAKKDSSQFDFTLNPPIPGWEEFFAEFSGCSFNNGLYRVHRADAVVEWNDYVCGVFPDLVGRILCFGYDWMGRHYALHFDGKGGEPQVALLEPGSAEAMAVPANFVQFHETELIVHRTECLEPDFYKEWLAAGNDELPHDRCAGMKVPLFLGGDEEVENLESSDMEVYWSLMGQVLQQVRAQS